MSVYTTACKVVIRVSIKIKPAPTNVWPSNWQLETEFFLKPIYTVNVYVTTPLVAHDFVYFVKRCFSVYSGVWDHSDREQWTKISL